MNFFNAHGRSFRSSKDRPITDQRLLDHHGDQLVILQLQGFIFFGTANSFYEKIKQLIDRSENSLKFVVMDMLAVYADTMAALEIQVMFETLIERMQDYLDKIELSAGNYLYRREDISTDVFFIVRGQVTLTGTNLEGTNYRFRTLGPWTLTGEIGAFLGYRAPYDAAVEKPGLIYKLSAENRKKLEAEDAALAFDLQRLIITMLGSQLMKTTRAIGGISS